MSTIQFIQCNPSELVNLIKEEIKKDFEIFINQSTDNKNTGKEFLSRKETAEFLNISLVCLHDWCHKGILIPFKMGNRTYFRYSDIVSALLASNKSLNHD